MLDITEIRVKKVNTIPPIRAFVSITIANAVAVHGIKVVEGDKGLFVAMPSRKDGNRHRDIFHPINQMSRDEIVKAVLDAYNAVGENNSSAV